MAMKPYPSNLIVFYVDGRILDEELKLDIKRSWTHIGEILVRPRPSGKGDEPVCSYVHVMVKFGTRRYLEVDGGESDDNWAQRMEQHLLSTMRKVGSNMVAFNRRRRKYDLPELVLDYIEFELEGGRLTLEYRLDSNGALPTDCARVATDVRTALGAGLLGDPVRVRVPSTRAYREQAEQAAREKAAAAERASAEAAVRAEAEERARAEAEERAEEEFMESPEMSAEVAREDAEAEAAAKADSPLEVAPLTPEEWEAEYGVRDADFAIDYRVWEAVYADGTAREFDSASGAFVA